MTRAVVPTLALAWTVAPPGTEPFPDLQLAGNVELDDRVLARFESELQKVRPRM